MKDFLKNILSSAIGVILAGLMVFGSIFGLVVIAGIANSLFEGQSGIDENSVLKIKFDYPIYDKPSNDPLINFSPMGDFGSNTSMHLYKMLESINKAQDNMNIAGIVLDLQDFQSPGLASSKEIRDALTTFKESGKFIYSYSNIFSQTAYYLASVSDSIFMYPTGGMQLSGLSTTVAFFTDAMAKIGIKPEIIRHGKFKAAIEPFMLTKMSKENREQTEILLADLWQNMLKDISINRNIKRFELDQIANNMLISMIPEKSVESGLIDKLMYPDDFNFFLKQKIDLEQNEKINFISLYDITAKQKKSKNKIAIIYAEGNIDGNKKNIHAGYTKTIKKVLKDDEISAVVFRVNSPGGSALISDEILTQMNFSKNTKPIVVSMGNYAASGGYYISCTADKIIASPNTITGSIGVFGLFFTAQELLNDKMKLHFDNVKTNKFSDLGQLNRSLSEEERSMIQVSIKNTYNNFITHVSNARDLSLQEVDRIGQGRVWTGIRAKEIGLVDTMGGLVDAIAVASDLAEIKDFQIIEFPKQKNNIEAFLEDLEQTKILKTNTVQEIYLKKLLDEFLAMEGVQAWLPIKYEIN